MDRHRKWRTRASLSETPTILVNSYKLPDEYEIEDLAMIVNTMEEENGSHDINGQTRTLREIKGKKYINWYGSLWRLACHFDNRLAIYWGKVAV